jgi:AraC family transcriptional regulator, melibiose operon regulatory protein
MNSEDYLLSALMSEPLLPPEISTLGIQSSQPGFKFGDHAYTDEVEIVYVLHGASYVGIDKQYIRIKKNDCLLIFPKVTHNYFLKENESCKIIDLVFKPGDISIFAPQDLRESLRFLYELKIPHIDYLRFVDNGEIKSTLDHILYQYEHPGQHANMLLKIYFCELYVLLSKVISETRDELGKPINQHVTNGLDYLVNFYSSRLTADEIARHVGLSPRHFSRLFAQEQGMTVQEYLSILRIKKAKDLLQNSDMDITGIAFSLGFNSSQYFITSFKRIEHVTPKTYRRMMQSHDLAA